MRIHKPLLLYMHTQIKYICQPWPLLSDDPTHAVGPHLHGVVRGTPRVSLLNPTSLQHRKGRSRFLHPPSCSHSKLISERCPFHQWMEGSGAHTRAPKTSIQLLSWGLGFWWHYLALPSRYFWNKKSANIFTYQWVRWRWRLQNWFLLSKMILTFRGPGKRIMSSGIQPRLFQRIWNQNGLCIYQDS